MGHTVGPPSAPVTVLVLVPVVVPALVPEPQQLELLLPSLPVVVVPKKISLRAPHPAPVARATARLVSHQCPPRRPTSRILSWFGRSHVLGNHALHVRR
jgi:hypothetical protein